MSRYENKSLYDAAVTLAESGNSQYKSTAVKIAKQLEKKGGAMYPIEAAEIYLLAGDKKNASRIVSKFLKDERRTMSDEALLNDTNTKHADFKLRRATLLGLRQAIENRR